MGSPKVALAPTMNLVLVRPLGTPKAVPGEKKVAFREWDFWEGSGHIESYQGC